MKTNLLYVCLVSFFFLSSCKYNSLQNQSEKDKSNFLSETVVETNKFDVPVNNKMKGKESINSNKNKTKIMNPAMLDGKFEKLDIEWLRTNATEKEPMGSDIYYSYEFKNNAITVFISGNSEGYNFFQINNDSYVALSKEYFGNGNIKSKGMTQRDFSLDDIDKLGIWYYFNENGQLVKTIDYDESFKVTFNDILDFCHKKGIPVEKGYSDQGLRTRISKNYSTDSKQSEWVIFWYKRPDRAETIRIDGANGKVISREESAAGIE